MKIREWIIVVKSDMLKQKQEEMRAVTALVVLSALFVAANAQLDYVYGGSLQTTACPPNGWYYATVEVGLLGGVSNFYCTINTTTGLNYDIYADVPRQYLSGECLDEKTARSSQNRTEENKGIEAVYILTTVRFVIWNIGYKLRSDRQDCSLDTSFWLLPRDRGTFNVTQPLEFAPDCKGGTTRTFNPTTGGENPPTDAAGLVYPSTALFIIVLLMSLLL